MTDPSTRNPTAPSTLPAGNRAKESPIPSTDRAAESADSSTDEAAETTISVDEQAVLDRIDEKWLVELTQSLLRATGQNPPGDEAATVAVLRSAAAELGLDVVETVVEPGRNNLSITLPGGDEPGLLLLGHTDVVPIGDGWTTDPFGSELIDGRIHGRGASDMKGGLAASLAALAALRGTNLSGPVELAALVDEEETGKGIRTYVNTPHQADSANGAEADDAAGGGDGAAREDDNADGVGAVSAEDGGDGTERTSGADGVSADDAAGEGDGGERSDRVDGVGAVGPVGAVGGRGCEQFRRFRGCITTEPTELQTIIGARGDSYLRVEVHGRACHAGNPADGANAIYGAAAVVAEIERLHAELALKPHPLLGPATWSVGQIQGGTGGSIVPAECVLVADRRLLPGESPEAVLDDLRARVAALHLEDRGLTVDLAMPMEMPAFETPADAELVHVTDTALTAVGGPGLPLGGWTAACDGGYIARDLAVPVVVLGPGSVTTQAHRADESVAVEELLTAARTYTLTALRLLRT